jgi:hypothetical protein
MLTSRQDLTGKETVQSPASIIVAGFFRAPPLVGIATGASLSAGRDWMSDPNKPDDVRPSRADVDDVADAAIGVDTRIFRTIWDTFLHTPRVVEAAYAGDREKYVPIIRFFLVLFGLQFALMAFADLPTGMSLEALGATPDTSASIDIWLESGRDCQARLALLDPGSANYAADRAEAMQACRDEVDLTLDRLSSLTSMPLAFLSTLPFLLLLKFYYWRRSFFGHVLAYLAATNASYILVLPFFLIVAFFSGAALFWSGFAASIIWYFVAMARLLHRFYSKNPLIITLQLLGQLAALPIMFLIIAIAQLWLVHLAVDIGHDLSLIDLMAIEAGLNPEDVS